MAPYKAAFLRRILHPDFGGINWTKVTWRAPFNNMYPITLSAGFANRILSNPISFGSYANRATRIHTRNLVLYLPTTYLAIWFVLQPDWYQFVTFHYDALGMPYPEWVNEQHKKDLKWMTRDKPGVLLKHKCGGQVSIPGTQEFVPE
eukprot:PhM_4_TR5548/c0_g1_i1/m.53515